jgi:hypothetical protein
MTEVAHYETTPNGRLMAVPAPTFEQAMPTDPTGGRLVAWAAGLFAAKQLGDALCQTTFAPKEFRGKAEDAAAAILHGDEVGLSPMQSLQSIYVISGKPALYARTMVAIVLAAGHEVWTVSKSDRSVTVAGRRRGSSHTIEETWTYDRARKAGYTSNKKYETDPAAMLYARAASDVCRQVAPDALAGLAFSVEELELGEAEPSATVSRTPRKATTAKRAPMPPEPDVEPVAGVLERDDSVAGAGEADDSTTPPGAEQSEVPATGPSEAQNRLMHRMFADLGITDRTERLEFTSEIVGRVLTTSTELTRGDASRLIDHMARELGEVAPDEDAS